MLIDKFQQHFEIYIFNAQMPSKVLKVRQLAVRPLKMSFWKFSVVSGFSNMLYDKKRKPRNVGNQ